MRIALVCLGNICRSPVAHVVVESRLRDAGIGPDQIEVVSAGTAGYHVGAAMDARSAATLSAAGYDPSRHRAQQFHPSWFDSTDLILAMDQANLDDLAALGQADPGQLRLFRSFDPAGSGDVPDPYYGGQSGFDEVLAMAERTADALVASLLDHTEEEAVS